MGNVIGQRWEVYHFENVKEKIPRLGEMVLINHIPDNDTDIIIQLVADGEKKIEELFHSWKSSEALRRPGRSFWGINGNVTANNIINNDTTQNVDQWQIGDTLQIDSSNRTIGGVSRSAYYRYRIDALDRTTGAITLTSLGSSRGATGEQGIQGPLGMVDGIPLDLKRLPTREFVYRMTRLLDETPMTFVPGNNNAFLYLLQIEHGSMMEIRILSVGSNMMIYEIPIGSRTINIEFSVSSMGGIGNIGDYGIIATLQTNITGVYGTARRLL